MKIRIKAKQVEIEYEEESDSTQWYFMTGKGRSDKGEWYSTEKYMECIQKLIDGVEQLLKV